MAQPGLGVLLLAESSKTALTALLRRYGMGVPDPDRALYSATLTLVAEARIHPYQREGASNAGKTREMNLHQLPWPLPQLEALGAAKVRMRVTLSYFVEPNPSSRGWTGRYINPLSWTSVRDPAPRGKCRLVPAAHQHPRAYRWRKAAEPRHRTRLAVRQQPATSNKQQATSCRLAPH